MKSFLLGLILLLSACQASVPIESIELAPQAIYQLNEQVLGHQISRKSNALNIRLLSLKMPILENGTCIRQVTSRKGEQFKPSKVSFENGKPIAFYENKKDWIIEYNQAGKIVRAGAQQLEYISDDTTKIETVHDKAVMVKNSNCYIIYSESKNPTSDFNTKTTICYDDKGLRILDTFEYELDGNNQKDGSSIKYDDLNRIIQSQESNIINGDTSYINTFGFAYDEKGLLVEESFLKKGQTDSTVFNYTYQAVQQNPLIIKQIQRYQGVIRKELTFHFDEAQRPVQILSSKGTKRAFTYE